MVFILDILGSVVSQTSCSQDSEEPAPVSKSRSCVFSFFNPGQCATVLIMSAVSNPALEGFLALVQGELVWAQILIRPVEGGYELRHTSDRSRPAKELRIVPLNEVRQLAQFTSAGRFRPLKSAPDLPSGWRIEVRDASGLGLAVDRLYPGSIADWFATQSLTPPVTNYRDFTNRQTGMYRITAKLSDEQAAQAIQACCHESLCLKRRLWSIAGLAPDASEAKSAIPCLEPCAIMLEFARKAMRLGQEEKANLALGHASTSTDN
jgi:sirohydrochlorin cobaltochelatase